MKVAVIGKGTSAVLSTLVFLTEGHDVEIYYDPEVPCLNVGETTTPPIAEIILAALDINIWDMIEAGIVSLKSGVKFIDWGQGKTFRHFFNNNSFAFHFESIPFNNYMHHHIEKQGVIYHAQRVDEFKYENDSIYIGDNRYDFVLSCVGWNDEDVYSKPIFPTLDTAILYTQNGLDEDRDYTIHKATKHGWQFGLPFPERNLTKCGYLFNRNIDSIEKVELETGIRGVRTVEWNPRYCKRLLQNKHLAYNGNRLFFLDPLHALSLNYYLNFTRSICEYLKDRRHETFEIVNRDYRWEMYKYEMSLAWHYQFGAVFDRSDFWYDVSTRAKKIVSSNPMMDREQLLRAFHHDDKYRTWQFCEIGYFHYHDYEIIENNLGGTDIREELKKINLYS